MINLSKLFMIKKVPQVGDGLSSPSGSGWKDAEKELRRGHSPQARTAAL